MYLADVIFPSTSVIVPTRSLQIHTNNITDTRALPLRLPYSSKHCVIHLSSDFHHTYTREFFPCITCISSENIILFHCSCIVHCRLFRHYRTRFGFYFSTKLSVFSQQFFCERHFYTIVFELTFYKSELEQTD
jgi:hypothetical protein